MNHRIKKSIKTYNDMVFYDGMSLIKKSGLNMILFELIYKLGFAAVFYPVFLFLLKFTLRKSGFLYLTNNYLFSYLKSPYTIISMVLILALLMIYVTYEVCCLSVCYDAAYHGTPHCTDENFCRRTASYENYSQKEKNQVCCLRSIFFIW